MFLLGAWTMPGFYFSLSHPLKTQLIFSWSLRSRLKKGSEKGPGPGDEEGRALRQLAATFWKAPLN